MATPDVSTRTVPRAKACEVCGVGRVVMARPRDGQRLCKDCFFTAFEEQVHQTIVEHGLLRRGERVAIAASGGKDSTVLAHVLSVLNTRHAYGAELLLLSVDEGITGYRDDSLDSVKRNQTAYGLPLHIVSYKQLYGWSMDEIVRATGLRNNCTFCGVFRRQALDRGAVLVGADKIATGHNADDIAETVLMNLLRGDISRLARCASIITGVEGALPRVKPFKYCYEREIVLYAHHKRLDYHSTECVYSPNAYRGFAREYLKDLEAIRPRVILDILRSAEEWRVVEEATGVSGGSGSGSGGIGGASATARRSAAATAAEQSSLPLGHADTAVAADNDDSGSVRTAGTLVTVASGSGQAHTARHLQRLTMRTRIEGKCKRCGYITSGELCQACNLLAGLAAGQPRLALSNARQRVKAGHDASATLALALTATTAAPALTYSSEVQGNSSRSGDGRKGCCGGTGGCGGGAGSCGSSSTPAAVPAVPAAAAEVAQSATGGCCEGSNGTGCACATAQEG